MSSIPHIGEILALATAFIWAVAVVLFKKTGETVHPLALNLFKSVLATVLLLPTIWLWEGVGIPGFTRGEIVRMLLSGALGIGIADTLFFMMLNRLGAALTAIVDCLYSPMVIAASMLFLGEHLSVLQLGGVALIVSAVWEGVRPPKTPANPHESRGESSWIGVVWGVLAMGCMAASIVLMKPLLDTHSLLWVMQGRVIGGIAILLVMLAITTERRAILGTLMVQKGWGYLVSSSFMGMYLALITWAAGIKYSQASTAAALNQTNNLIVFVLAGIFLKEPLTKQRIIGIGLAVVGVYLVTFG